MKDVFKVDQGRMNRYNNIFDRLFTSRTLSNGTRTAWFSYLASSLNSEFKLDAKIVDNLIDENILNSNEWQYLWGGITGQSMGDIKAHWIPEVLNLLSPVNIDYPHIELIPAIRRIGEAGTPVKEKDYSGMGIIDRLA